MLTCFGNTNNKLTYSEKAPDYLIKGNLESTFNYLNDRHNMWINRYVKGYTQDILTSNPVLRDSHISFLNVYRELDRTTLYMTEKFFPQIPKEHWFVNMVFYKHINNIAFFEKIGWIESNVESIKSKIPLIEKFLESGENIFIKAYRTNGVPSGTKNLLNTFPQDKKVYRILNSIVLHILPILPDINKLFEESTDMKEVWDYVKKIPMLTGFIGNEVLWGMYHIGMLRKAAPFCRIGEGCWDTLFWLGAKNKAQGEDIMTYIYNAQDSLWKDFNIDFKGPKLNLLNVENIFCEMRKYRVHSKPGKHPGVSKKYHHNDVDFNNRTKSYLSLFNSRNGIMKLEDWYRTMAVI